MRIHVNQCMLWIPCCFHNFTSTSGIEKVLVHCVQGLTPEPNLGNIDVWCSNNVTVMSPQLHFGCLWVQCVC